MAIVATLGVLLTACGGGDGDEEPTATSVQTVAQPTVEASAEASTPQQDVPANTDMSSPDVATPSEAEVTSTAPLTSDEASPDASVIVGDAATPAAEVPVDAAEEEAATTATPAADSTDDGEAASTGDGTTGAVTPSLEAANETPSATPSSAAAMATPAPDASPQASPVSGTPEAADEPLIVTGCDVEDVPAFEGDVTTYVLSVDLNFRSGPGSDCDLLGDGPLGEFSGVEVIGGPVIREGEESLEWVQVQVGVQTGWLAQEFLEPAD